MPIRMVTPNGRVVLARGLANPVLGAAHSSAVLLPNRAATIQEDGAIDA